MEINRMTLDELRAKAKSFNAVNNEGGDGYNPYAQEIERRIFDEIKSLEGPKKPQEIKWI